MKLTVLGSGSRGNAFAVTADGVTLMLDAGFSLRTLRRRSRTAGLDLSTLIGVILTHEHQDHASGGRLLANAARTPLFASRGTLERLDEPEGIPLDHLETVAIGPFEVTTCRVVHDATEPFAVAVAGPGGERVVLAYDMGRTTAALRYFLRGADCLILESNHDESMLRASPYPPSVRRRIGGPEGHLSNLAAASLLTESCHGGLQAVVLAHVSEICNRPSLAEGTAGEALAGRRFGGRLLVAAQDAPLETLEIAC